MKMSNMRVKDENNFITTNNEDRIESLFRYVNSLENRIHELERRQKNFASLIQKGFRKLNILRRRFDGFSPLKNKFYKNPKKTVVQ